MAPPLSLKMSDHGTMLRRKEERHSVRAEAKISYRGICSDAMIVDVSAGGLRLDGTFGLMVGDAVVVGLSSGYEATGRDVNQCAKFFPATQLTKNETMVQRYDARGRAAS